MTLPLVGPLLDNTNSYSYSYTKQESEKEMIYKINYKAKCYTF